MARNGHRLSLHGVEQLSKLVLRFGGRFGNHGATPNIAILAKIANLD
jgi:hypothetical protein